MNYASIFIFEKYFLYQFMDIKVIKGVENYLYDDDLEFRAFNPGKKIVGNWRDGNTGDWVYISAIALTA